MDVTGNALDDALEAAAPKAPRKPRPSEIAAKKAKTAKSKKAVKKAVKKSKPAASRGVVMRSERLDMRVTKAEKARVRAKAKKVKRTITSVVLEAIEKIK